MTDGAVTRTILADTHAHLSDGEFSADLPEVLERATSAGVGRILAVGEDLASSRTAIELAHRFDAVYAAVGLHPQRAARFGAEFAELESLLAERKVVAVGEIGLDYYRSGASPAQQKEAFREQLRWAARRGLPVSIHNRSADVDVLGSIREIGGQAILHCFSGTWAVAEQALQLGCYVSFAGNVTYPRAQQLREVAALLPLERMLLETDAPVLAPQSIRGRRNEPANVGEAAQAIANARGCSLDEIASVTLSNARELFSWGHA